MYWVVNGNVNATCGLLYSETQQQRRLYGRRAPRSKTYLGDLGLPRYSGSLVFNAPLVRQRLHLLPQLVLQSRHGVLRRFYYRITLRGPRILEQNSNNNVGHIVKKTPVAATVRTVFYCQLLCAYEIQLWLDGAQA